MIKYCIDFFVKLYYNWKEDNGAFFIKVTIHTVVLYFCLKKYYGKKRIAAELMGRGYERKAIFEAIDSVTAEEYSYALRRLISQKFKTPPADRREQDNRIAALSRMGFSISEIMTALKENKADYWGFIDRGLHPRAPAERQKGFVPCEGAN